MTQSLELKKLRSIQFPNREHELDGILLRFKGNNELYVNVWDWNIYLDYLDLPLESLNFSGFLNLTDEGAQSIACMKHLRDLSLDGSKVTDEGISLFDGNIIQQNRKICIFMNL